MTAKKQALQKPEDLVKLLHKLQEDLRVQRFGMSGTSNTKQIRDIKREVARILTQLN
ncbi:MAG: ribosomal protein L29 [Planctomycetota bacterium]|jgi:ribosomal protein L29